MTPLQNYCRVVAAGELEEDALQADVMQVFDAVYHELVAQPQATQSHFTDKFLHFFRKPEPSPSVKGVYLWGHVGRGKTHLANLFYDCLPFPEKHRVHYHRLMLELQRDIHQLQQEMHTSEPLEIVAERMATHMRLLFIDEVHIHNIGDAMTISALLHGLVHHGVVCVMTSNVAPQELYTDGLQAASFEPARQLIQQECHVLSLDSDRDYRLRALTPAEVFFFAQTGQEKVAVEMRMLEEFKQLGMVDDAPEFESNVTLTVNKRSVQALYRGDAAIWFRFKDLCKTHRSASDYIDLSKDYDTFFVSDIPQMDDYRNDEARRFINLIDQLYAARVNLVMSAEVALDQFYTGNLLKDEFQRTVSRLKEMQSQEYLDAPHIDKI